MEENKIYHAMTEEYVDTLQSLVNIDDRHLFRTMIMFYYGVIAATQNAVIVEEGSGDIPINFYATILAPSGFGKNLTTGTIEKSIFKPFYERFKEETFPVAKSRRFEELYPSYERELMTANSVTPPSEEEVLEIMNEEYAILGNFIPFFEEATPAAVRQLTAHIKMTGCNSLNLVVDEIGSSLKGITEVLPSFLKLYDIGESKTKVLKNYKDSSRATDIDKPSPANMLLFGEPNMLLDGGENQRLFHALLLTGFARRVVFAMVEERPRIKHTGAEMYERAVNSRKRLMDTDRWAELGNLDYYNKRIYLNKDQAIKLYEYRIKCNELAAQYKSHESMKATELENRFFKVKKMAGALAFIDKSDEITDMHLDIAIGLAEESGKHFLNMLERPESYEIVLKYLEEHEGMRVTKAELHKNVSCFKGSSSNQNTLLDLAISHGVSKNTVVAKTQANGVEYFTATVLEPTDLSQLIMSASNHPSDGYVPYLTNFEKIKALVARDGFAFSNHHFLNQHRSKTNLLEGFNVLVLDIDGTATLETVQHVLKNFKYVIYTTKSHTETEHHFRIILPLSHKVKLNADKFSQFMLNVFDFLPFTVDEVTKDGSRMWYTNANATIIDHMEYEGEELELFPATWFIPDSRDAETMVKDLAKFNNSNIVRYFHKVSKFGVRNNNLYRYARFLIDSGHTNFEEVIKKVKELNSTLDHPISEEELNTTVFKSISKHFN